MHIDHATDMSQHMAPMSEISHPVTMPKRSFFDYQYRDGPDYNISFDRLSGQPIMNSMDAMTMHNRLQEVHNQIAINKMEKNELAQ